MDSEKERMATAPAKEEQKAGWTPEQDSLLHSLISASGTKDWPRIADAINASFSHAQKTAKQCAGRWQEFLEVEGSKRAWTEQDELNMIIAHKRHKNRWADISESLKGRSNNTIKNKFYSVFRKIRGKILKSDCSYVSKLELLEIHYIISLIEQYLAHPMQTPKTKGKRGKDFIYSLIHSLNDKMVSDYKVKIRELTKQEGNMDDLFNRLAAQLQMAGPAERVPPPEHSGVMFPRTRPAPILRRDEFAEPICPSKCTCEPVKIEEDKLLSNVGLQHEQGAENSPLFGNAGALSPSFLFSPTTLSVGPAAAAAGAVRAACFGNSMSDFSEVSNVMRSLSERSRPDAAHLRGDNGRLGNGVSRPFLNPGGGQMRVPAVQQPAGPATGAQCYFTHG